MKIKIRVRVIAIPFKAIINSQSKSEMNRNKTTQNYLK